MSPIDIEIGRFLAKCAFNAQRPTYRELATAINWNHPMGRGLGAHLWNVLQFTHDATLPCLTSILCEAGKLTPREDALGYIRQVYGDISIEEEQQRVFAFDWTSVEPLAFEQPSASEIDFDRIYATRTWGFDPENWGMTGFRSETTRDSILNQMHDRPIYIVSFCSQHTEEIDGHDGRFTIQPADVARVLGISEVQPRKASHETHTSPAAVQEILENWGSLRWSFGLANSRAWEIVERPWTREVLPHARSTSWEATRGIVPLTDEEKRLVRQYQLHELPVYNCGKRPIAYALREPMHTTYLAICDDPGVLKKANAPRGTKLVKIGVSGDTKRRLRDLNDHHFAKIFGLSFAMYATQRGKSERGARA